METPRAEDEDPKFLGRKICGFQSLHQLLPETSERTPWGLKDGSAVERLCYTRGSEFGSQDSQQAPRSSSAGRGLHNASGLYGDVDGRAPAHTINNDNITMHLYKDLWA